MLTQGLQPGVRVRSRRATTFAGRGTPGCVLGAWPTIPHAYEVRFDGHCLTWLMWEDELECVEVEVVAAELDAH
jgi:hypothetical protein